MLTRSQVAKRLGRSVATVRKMEGRVLHPTRNERGVWLFDEKEVDNVAHEVTESGRALSADDEEFSPRWQPPNDVNEEDAPATVPDRWEFEQAQRRIREHRAEIAALQARVESLEEDADVDLDDGLDNVDEPTSHGPAFFVVLLGAVGVALVALLKRRGTPGSDAPAR